MPKTEKPVKKNADGSTRNELRAPESIRTGAPKSKSAAKREAAQAKPVTFSATDAPEKGNARLTAAEREKHTKTVLSRIKLKKGASSSDLITATGATAGQVRGILRDLVKNGQATRQGTPKASTYHLV